LSSPTILEKQMNLVVIRKNSTMTRMWFFLAELFPKTSLAKYIEILAQGLYRVNGEERQSFMNEGLDL
jgi:hypothetical protein